MTSTLSKGLEFLRIFFLANAASLAVVFLLLMPFATALSRNIAFPILLVSTALFAWSAHKITRETQGNRQRVAFFFTSMPDARIIALILATAVFSAISLTWSPNPGRGLSALGQILTASVATALCCTLVWRTPLFPRWLQWALPLSIVAGCCIILIELVFNSPIRSFLGASTEGFRLNRAAVSVSIMAAHLILSPLGRHGLILKIAVVGLVWIAAFTSISESAKLAIVAVSVTFFLSLFLKPRTLLILCGSALLISHVASPLIAWAIYKYLPQEAFAAVGYPGQHWRAIIWWAYSTEIWNAPVFGHGLQASLGADAAYLGADPDITIGLQFGHPHNFSIQLWYELGLVGITLSTVLFTLLIRRLHRLDGRQKVTASALLAGVWSVAYVSHGAWQHWWWALVGIVIILFVALSRLDNEQRREDSEARNASEKVGTT